MENEKFNKIKEKIKNEISKSNFDIFLLSSLLYDFYEEDKNEFFKFIFEILKNRDLINLSEKREKIFKIIFDLFEDHILSNQEFLSFLSRFSGEYPEVISVIDFSGVEKEKAMALDSNGKSIFHWLALWSDKNGWTTTDPEILKLKDSGGWSVAHYLADNKTLTVKDPDILELKSNSGITVKQLLKK